MKLEELQQKIIGEIDSSIQSFNDGVPSLEKAMYERILSSLRGLDIKDGVIQNNAKNLRIISELDRSLEGAILNPEYLKQVKGFIQSFSTVGQYQSQYFNMIQNGWKPNEALANLKNIAVDTTLESLTETGIKGNVVNKIRDLLTTNITSGGKYSDLIAQVSEFVVSSKDNPGVLQRHVGQVTIDSLHTYARTYDKMVSDDLGLEWFMYTGSLIETSRCFCQAMVKKKYFHKSEVSKILSGDFQEYADLDCSGSSSTGLPAGMIDGTNESNFFVRAGGYRCGHKIAPVISSIVPAEIRRRFEKPKLIDKSHVQEKPL